MTIHYNGDLSKRPGQKACTRRGAIDFAQQWTPVDCTQCKATLIGMAVVKIADSTVRGIVADVDVTAGTVLIETPVVELGGSDVEPDPAYGVLDFETFEQHWRREL